GVAGHGDGSPVEYQGLAGAAGLIETLIADASQAD
ncbi:hypothetical protein PSYPI_38559, partial [Pseudomonas syringae pv. pisi str. 1704B]